MYNDTIKVSNKIITYDDLLDIFAMMQEKLVYYKKIYNNEEMRNRVIDYSHQIWTFKDSDSHLRFNVNFYDDTNINFDKYDNFISIFNNRLDEIKSIWVYYRLSYSTRSENGKTEHYSQYINMEIREKKIDISISLSSEDRKIDEVYELIKNRILNAPEKYDNLIKKKSSITTTVNLGIGFIPALIISTILLFVPTVRLVFATSYILYPICCLVLAFFIGGTIGGAKLDSLYKTISPEQKYAGYDSYNRKSIYKDDIDKYIETSEILIGKNADNLKYRKEIMDYYEKYKKYIPYEIIIMLIISFITIFLK